MLFKCVLLKCANVCVTSGLGLVGWCVLLVWVCWCNVFCCLVGFFVLLLVLLVLIVAVLLFALWFRLSLDLLVVLVLLLSLVCWLLWWFVGFDVRQLCLFLLLVGLMVVGLVSGLDCYC